MTRPLVLALIFLVSSLILTAFLPSLLIPPAQISAIPPPPSPSIPQPRSAVLPQPAVSAQYVIALDQATKTVLYSRSADTSVPPASTTKVMTALVALDRYPLDQIITVTDSFSDGQVVGFSPGERLTVEQLLYALLIQSGNDAAEILAQNYPGGREAFISAMNAKADALHLTHTHFNNPTGLDDPAHYSSASDLARLADYAMDSSEFARIVGTEAAVIPGNHVLVNLNQLLGKIPGVLGVKTGNTTAAGQALVTLVNQGHPVILVVLKSSDRFSDTENLIHWVYSNFTWALPADI